MVDPRHLEVRRWHGLFQCEGRIQFQGIGGAPNVGHVISRCYCIGCRRFVVIEQLVGRKFKVDRGGLAWLQFHFLEAFQLFFGIHTSAALFSTYNCTTSSPRHHRCW